MKKKYLILGASSDLGIGLMKSLAQTEELENIYILAHFHSSNKEILNVFEEYPELKGCCKKADMSDLQDVQRFISELKIDNFMPTYIVNFCANAYHFNRFSEWDFKRIEQDMMIQVFSFAEIVKAFIANMEVEQYGKIVVMLSSATKGIPPANTTEYATVKYALWGLVKSLAAEYGNKGININAVSPGMIDTKFIRGISRKIREFTAERSPQHRNLQVSDVIPTIKLLLSDDSQYMNGTNISLSGLPD